MIEKFINTIHNEDCFDIFPKILSDSVDLVIVDPPYGIKYKEWDNIEDFLDFTERWVSECFRVLKSTGTMWSFMGYSNIIEFVPVLRKYGNVYLH